MQGEKEEGRSQEEHKRGGRVAKRGNLDDISRVKIVVSKIPKK